MWSLYDNIDKKEYQLKTGRDYDLLITNVSPEYLYIYEKIVPKFQEIEILDKAYNVFGEMLIGLKAVVFKEKFNMDILQDFWKEHDCVLTK